MLKAGTQYLLYEIVKHLRLFTCESFKDKALGNQDFQARTFYYSSSFSYFYKCRFSLKIILKLQEHSFPVTWAWGYTMVLPFPGHVVFETMLERQRQRAERLETTGHSKKGNECARGKIKLHCTWQTL